MLLTERSSTETDATPRARGTVSLRLQGGTPDERLIPIAAGKHTIGSGPRCSIRLQHAGVSPLHCLIVHDAQGTRVRRWATDTRLNDAAFDETPLAPGDRLSVGSVEMEVVGPVEPEVAESPPAADADPPQQTPPESAWTALDADEAGPPRPEQPPPQAPVGEVEHLREANGIARVRSRRLIAALRQDRDDFAALIQRIDALEQKVDAAVGDREGHAAGQVDADLEEAAEAAGAAEWPSIEDSTAESDSASWADEWLESAGDAADRALSESPLVARLTETEQQLADAKQQLVDAQATIDALEQQLAELEQERQQQAEEHADWLQQMTELETRLAEYARRVPELEAQLEQLCGAAEAAARVRRSSVAQTPAVPPSAAEEESYNWSAHAGSAPPGDESAVVEQAWSAPEHETAPEEPAEPSAVTESEPASEYDWSGRGNTAGQVDASTEFHFDGELDATDHEAVATDDGVDATRDEGLFATDSMELEPAGKEPPVATDWASAFESGDSAESSAADSPPEYGAELPAPLETDPAEPVSEAIQDEITDEPEVAGTPATPPAAERKSDELDSMMEHLRGLSLWRGEADAAAEPPAEPATADEPTAAGEPPPAGEPATAPPADATTEDEPTVAADSRTASFIERYAHLFEDDQSGQPSPPEPVAAPTVSQPPAAEPLEPAPASAPSSDAASTDDDESIEQYMAKMMQRLGGTSSAGPASQAPPPSPTAQPVTQQSSSSAPEADATAPSSGSAIIHRPQRKIGPAPERNTDMAALRALANQSARHAIGVHTAGKLRRHAVTRFIIAMLAGTASLYFFLAAPNWESLEFTTAGVALLASVYWGRLTFGSLVQAVRAGAFDDYGNEFAAVGTTSEELPIDVEHD